MITILKTTELGLQPNEALSDGSWVHLIDPSAEDLAHLREEWGIPADFITAPLDIDERPRVERDDGLTLIIMRIPHVQGREADVPFVTIPLGIILTEQLIVTVCKHPSPIIDDLARGRVRGMSTTKRIRFVLQLLLSVAAYYLRVLRHLNGEVDALEDRLQKALQNRELLELLKYQKSLTYLNTALKSNELVLRRLQKMRLFHQYEEDEDLLDDLVTEFAQAIEMTNISADILGHTTEAFAGVISNNLNVVMKFMAAFTIILALPTLVASIFGMNVDLPFEQLDHGFGIVMGVAFGAAALTLFIFWRKDWL